MSKYVDIVWLSSAIHNLCKGNPITEDEIHSIIAKAPTKEIGMCKDCKYSWYASGRRVCRLLGFREVPNCNYCAGWEKKKK